MRDRSTERAIEPPRLETTPEGLALISGKMVVSCDFTRMLPRIRAGRLGRELLVRAARIKGADELRAADATAGLGEDSFLLAAAGFSVTLIERDRTIAALLRDGLARARELPELAEAASRMELVEGDSIALLPELAGSFDVVYLDPMFPAKKKDAAAKKKLQLIQMLERPCEDERALLDAALAARPRKVVVKRPLKGPYLADVQPARSLAGTTVRYDVIGS